MNANMPTIPDGPVINEPDPENGVDLPVGPQAKADDDPDSHVPTVEVGPPAKRAEPKRDEPVLRPSDLAELAEIERLDNPTSHPQGVDLHRFAKAQGFPNPQKRYRVTARKGTRATNPIEVDAVDEGDAIRQVVEMLKITQTHQWNWNTFVIAQ